MSRLKQLRNPLQALPGSGLRELKPDSWRDGKTTGERGYDYRWQKARLQHLKKEPLCRMCREDGRAVPVTVVDHIVPHEGNRALFWDQTNWQSLCATHHSSHKQREEAQASDPR